MGSGVLACPDAASESEGSRNDKRSPHRLENAARQNGAQVGYNARVYLQPSRPAKTFAVFRLKTPPVFSTGLVLRAQSWARTNSENRVPAPLLPIQEQALLALADGTVFQGISIGAAGHTVGEVVFNTSLTGYQEMPVSYTHLTLPTILLV